jgi:hypothetical protein
MKVLDEKGRLFGKINLVDALVILVIAVVAIGVIWKLFGQNIESAVSASSNQTLTYEVICYGVDNDVCDAVMSDAKGQLMSNGSLVNGYVVDCQRENYYATDINEDGQVVMALSPTKSNLRFTIVYSLPSDDLTNAVGSQEVRIGKSHIVKTCDLEITGTVTAMTITDGAPDFQALGVAG